jgi:NAD(P)-dependent dehydrogenase (short-subunit alcohol dehydrogenase family)
MLTHPHAGQVALVTGATHGIGYQVAGELAAAGATVIAHARTREEAHQTVVRLVEGGADPGLLRAEVADFTQLREVRTLAGRIADGYGRLDLLVNNAAVVAGARRHVTVDGHESTFQVNYLAHYLLTRQLWRSLCEAPHGRVVNLSSAVHRSGQLTWADLDKAVRYTPIAAYAQSKLALTMLTQALVARSPHGVVALSVHPGVIATGAMHRIYGRYGAPIDDGAAAVLHLCWSDRIRNGGYYEGKMPAMPAPLVQDPGSVDRLWRLSARLTGLVDPTPAGPTAADPAPAGR